MITFIGAIGLCGAPSQPSEDVTYSEPLLRDTQRHPAASAEAPAQPAIAASEHPAARLKTTASKGTPGETPANQQNPSRPCSKEQLGASAGSTTPELEQSHPGASNAPSEFAMPVGKKSSENADVDWLAPNTAVQSQQVSASPKRDSPQHAQSQALKQQPPPAHQPTPPSSTEQASPTPAAKGLASTASKTPADQGALAAGKQSPTDGFFLGEAAASKPSASDKALNAPKASPIKPARATSQQLGSSSSAEALKSVNGSNTKAAHSESQHQSKAAIATEPQSTPTKSAAQEGRNDTHGKLSTEDTTAANQSKAGKLSAAAEDDQNRKVSVEEATLSDNAQAVSVPSSSPSAAPEDSLQAAASSKASSEAKQHDGLANGQEKSGGSAEDSSQPGKTRCVLQDAENAVGCFAMHSYSMPTLCGFK